MKKLTLIFISIICILSITNAQNCALDFDGSGDYIDIGSGPSSVKTVEFWVNSASTTEYLIDLNGSAYISVSSGTITATGFTSPTIYVNGEASTTLTASSWLHIAVTTSTAVDASNFDLGRQGSNYFEGKLDEVRLWSDVRSQLEIRTNMYQAVSAGETGLVAYYKLNETTGSTANDSQTSGTYDGTLTGTGFTCDANAFPSPAFFGPKNCLDFDGVNDNVWCSSFSPTLTSGTIEFWLNLDVLPDDDARLISSRPYFGYDEVYLSSGVGRIKTSGSFVDGDDLQSSSTIPVDTWTHIAITADGDGSKIYINGILDGEGAAAAFDYTTFKIGGQSDVGGSTWYSIDGMMDEVRVWSDVRTDYEIRRNMYNTLVGNESDLVAYYNFDNANGAVLQNYPASGNDGALVGGMSNDDWVTSTAFNTWLNTNDSDWGAASNWSDGAEPTSSDNVGIPNSGGTQPTITAATNTVKNLVVVNGATLTYNYSGSHTISGNAFVIGTTDINSGNLLTVTGYLFLLYNSNLNVKAGGKLTVGSLEVLPSGTLTLNSTSSGTGSLIAGPASVYGQLEIERYITAWTSATDGWHLLSSPVASQTIRGYFVPTTPTTNEDFYSWDEVNDIWINSKSNPATWNSGFDSEFIVGKGYLVAYGSTTTKYFSGTPNSSDVTKSGLTYTDGSTHTGWHLLGNPYPSALYWNKTAWSLTDVDATAKIWKESTAAYIDIFAGSTDIIPAMQGFMVHASVANASLNIDASDRTHNSQDWYKDIEVNKIKLIAYDPEGSTAQESIIKFNENATPGLESEYDSHFLSGYAPYLYSAVEGIRLSTNALPELKEELSIPLYFKKNSSSTFYIEAEGLDNLIPSYPVYLTDLKIDYTQNLTINPVYSFTSEEGDEMQRFLLHFKAVGVEEQQSFHSNIQIWSANRTVYILNPENRKGELSVLNLFGQQVAQAKLTGDTEQEIQLSVPTACYLVNIISEKSIVNRKVLIER